MTLGFNEILASTWQLLRAHSPRAGLAIAVLTGLGFLIDSGIVESSGFNAVINGATLAFQYWLTRSLLQELDYAMPERPRGWAFVGLGIVSGLAILLGLVLLVVPGVILLVRWSIAMPCLLSSDDGIFDCMRRSWHQTEGHFWPVFTGFLAVYLPPLVLGLGGLAAAEWGGQPYAGILLAGLALNMALVAGWLAAVAIFAMLNPAPALVETFE